MNNAQTVIQQIEALGYKVNSIGSYYYAIKGNKGIKSNSTSKILTFLTNKY